MNDESGIAILRLSMVLRHTARVLTCFLRLKKEIIANMEAMAVAFDSVHGIRVLESVDDQNT
jgi:predicted exporter